MSGLDDPWVKMAERLEWFQRWSRLKNTSFNIPVSIRWFEGGKLNVSHNCIDRHLAVRANKTAILWEGDDPAEVRRISYRELHEKVCRLSNVLKAHGVCRGDRVTLYLPMIPEAAFCMLACARIGAIHSVVFGGFSAESLAGRILDGDSRFVITADEGLRGGKTISLKLNVDAALQKCPQVSKVLVVRRTGGNVPMKPGRDLVYEDELAKASSVCPPESMDSEDPLFILYTSGSTGKPKGILHTTGGYLAYASHTHHSVFDHREDDVFWCTADVGWVTGHSYVVYGPLSNGATTLMFEGVPHHPSPSRFWEVVDRHGVTVFYTAPTAIRALMREGDAPVMATSRASLHLLGSVGEPINPEAWAWYHRVVGGGRCSIVDTWWQTETGGILISPLPGTPHLKPGSAMSPLAGIKPAIVDDRGNILEGPCSGNLCLLDSWPGQARTIWGDHARFEQTYFSAYPGKYFTGDGAKRDADGDYWITGRVDDVLNVSGHRLGTAEVESALVGHPSVAESAVVGRPHDIKGQGIHAFVTLKAGSIPSSMADTDALATALKAHVVKEIGALARPDVIQFAPGLPKTRSGKIMRRILRKIAEGDTSNLGDISTLADPGVIQALIKDARRI